MLRNVKSYKRPTHLRIVKSPRKVFKELKLFATDVDGVLTDAGMYYGESGEELKKFNTHDGMGVKLLQADGVIVAIITAENTKIVARRAKKLGISEVFQGVKDKVLVLTHLSKKFNVPTFDLDDLFWDRTANHYGIKASDEQRDSELLIILKRDFFYS